jgi:aspartyl-tRNA(Asn)/glutamyl-tRNA(Gln) amidotransferase subunit A
LFEFSSIEQYHAQLNEGTVTCLQAVEHYLLKIKASKHLNAFIEVYADEALQRAKQLDTQRNQSKKIGKLHGVIIAIKDVICYKDHKVSASSNILKNGLGFISLYSATAIERLLADEAIIIGNLNCDEFAMGSTNENSSYGPVLNALDETRVPGGSSGGSAVAVQAGLCMVSLGSDTGGSVRQPADHCGIIGMKPTYGRISRYGLIAYASSFDQIGILGTNLADIALLLEVMAGPDEYDSTALQKAPDIYSSYSTPHKKYRFAYFEETLDHPVIDREIVHAIRSTINKLKTGGHDVEAVKFEWLDYIVPAYYILTTAEASSNLSRYDGIKYGYSAPAKDLELIDFYKQTRSTGFGKEVKRRIMLGTFVLSTGYYDAYFTRAQKMRRVLADKIRHIFNEYDFIIMPTVLNTAPKVGEEITDPSAIYLSDIYTVTANLVGTPAISLPLFRHSNNMPFGIQVMANQWDELSLLRVSNMIMKSYTG